MADLHVYTPASATEDAPASLSTPPPSLSSPSPQLNGKRKRFTWSEQNKADLDAAVLAYNAIPNSKNTPRKVAFIVAHMNTPGVDNITVTGRLETVSRLKKASGSLQAT
mmetsp:Transcript_14110/g.23356  ORF Transcript_14110/g.23356 Transcript_14110/m.23356 type:complete len:109 (-) Transcript_14110:65-391(-)